MTLAYDPRFLADSVKPYFQVVIFTHDGLSLSHEELPVYISRSISIGGKNDYVLRHITTDDQNLLAYEVEHTYPPTWIKGNLRESLRNSEHDLILIFRTQEYLFVHISCDTLADAVLPFFMDSGYVPITPDQIMKMVATDDVQLRTLGIHNVFAPTGVAPQAKSYSGRNVRDSLTPTSDGGFGFSYASGVVFDPATKKAQSFGCSLGKYKVWLSWTDGIDDFVAKCSALVNVFRRSATAQGFGVLATLCDPSGLTLEPVLFSMDYYVHKKGLVMVSIGGHKASALWTCSLSATSADTVVITARDAAGADHSIELKIAPDADNHWCVEYADPKKRASVYLVDDDLEPAGKRAKDLKQYLNDQGHFTIIFSCGVAYREGLYWEDRRYAKPFTRSEGTLIDWSKTNIKAESKVKGKSDTIADAIEGHLAGVPTLINDDGSGEVADFISIDRAGVFTLIHAKYSAEPTKGLRVGDLQVVCSQAIKNLPNFTAATLLKRLDKWAARQVNQPALPPTVFKSIMKDAIVRLPSTEKELWIVQPGISKAMLDADPSNKIHVLLNYVDAQCRAQDVRFRFVCDA